MRRIEPAGTAMASRLLDPFCTARGFPMFRASSQAIIGSPSMGPAGGTLRVQVFLLFYFLAATLPKIQKSKKKIESAGSPEVCCRVAARSYLSRGTRLNTLRFKCF